MRNSSSSLAIATIFNVPFRQKLKILCSKPYVR